MESFSPKEIDKPKNGIELKMLLSQNKDDLICPICQNLIWNYTDCSQCGNLFCSSCINESLSKVKDSCPICKTTPFKSSGSKALKKLFVNIKLKCPNQPCDEKIEYSEYINHLEKCKYRKYRCNNNGCDYENTLENKKELEEHSITCQYKKIKCKYCEKEIKQIDFNKHETKECQGLMECPFCKLPMKRKTFLSNHADSNTNNIKCLKTKVDYYIKECKKYKDELKKLQASSKKEVDDIKKGFDTELDELKEKYKKLMKENKKLNEDIMNWDTNFQKMHQKVMLNAKRRRSKDKK
jgi:hypothetical protein